ncbi:pullulanase-type alpha-1,6-glucosidase [Ideonella sp.]|uniref:pullulanase-type alpha-1,6-glucosidase n=1 Tax=Ideonella sp. TaxID=1929293 RepID=UPI003BB7A88F
MNAQWLGWLRKARQAAAGLAVACLVAACGGSSEAPSSDASLSVANMAGGETVLQAVPDARRQAQAAAGGTTFKIHYRRADGDTSGWQVHTWGAAQDPGWNAGWNPTGSDDFGAVYEIPLNADSGTVGYLLHKGDTKDFGGADQAYVLQPGANEIWRLEGDGATYTSNPLESGPPDLTTIRVHYQRFDTAYNQWGLHLWNGSGLDVARLPAGVAIENWNAAVPFSSLAGYAQGAQEVVFELPVLNPKDDAGRKALTFVLHGLSPNQNDKDGWSNDIRIEYGNLKITNKVGEIWLVQQDPTVHYAVPDLRSVSSSDARAVWLNKQLVQWPRVFGGGSVRLYYSADGQIVVAKDAAVSGADGYIELDLSSSAVPADLATRFKWVAAGGVYQVRSADLKRLNKLHTQQLVLVQVNAEGLVQNATTAQVAGALDDLYAAAGQVNDYGAKVMGGATQFRLWAPTARSVALYVYDNASDPAVSADEMVFDKATGSWSLSKPTDLSGKFYRFGVRVFVRNVGVVRNIVTDPYSLSLSANSQRSLIANLDAEAFKPNGWDTSTPPAKVAASPDMSIYELHVRDFSATDSTVPEAHRGKYLAFTNGESNGMKHLKALAQAGMTDVHLLPVFDLASVPEKGCVTPTPSGAADSDSQQAAVAATAGTDCFNWGYDPYHFTAPEGSFTSNPENAVARIVEFRRMVKALNNVGLRVGMDVVYNHTSASGQNSRSVLDRVVPGYYHRLNGSGAIEQSTCCENTAAENLMMAKLMVDSAITWTRDYHISSLRFDIMGHHPRSVLEDLKAKVKAATGRDVQIIGEGWNFGEVANGARFVQADMLSLNGSGIGTFNPFIRDALRGGSSFDRGNSQISNQGYLNGLYFDPNALGGGRSKNDLMWLGDIVKASLAGSIRSYQVTTHWDANIPLEQINVGGLPAGYVLDPSEVVNYFENHDNTTLFDNNAFKLPTNTSKEDRARVQHLASAINVLSQGIPYFHAGVDTLRSKSMDRNSYNSGDWFNRLDWSYAENNFGVGLPPAADNADNWDLVRPLLANADIKPGAVEIDWSRRAFLDLLKIRKSSTLLRLRTADDIKSRLVFHNTGSSQEPTMLVGQLNGEGYAGAKFKELVYVVNIDKADKTLAVPALQGKPLKLHPVHAAAGAADQRAAQASFDKATGQFSVPARTAVVFVRN